MTFHTSFLTTRHHHRCALVERASAVTEAAPRRPVRPERTRRRTSGRTPAPGGPANGHD